MTRFITMMTAPKLKHQTTSSHENEHPHPSGTRHERFHHQRRRSSGSAQEVTRYHRACIPILGFDAGRTHSRSTAVSARQSPGSAGCEAGSSSAKEHRSAAWIGQPDASGNWIVDALVQAFAVRRDDFGRTEARRGETRFTGRTQRRSAGHRQSCLHSCHKTQPPHAQSGR